MITTCEHCIFKEFDAVQTGCYFKRPEKFEKAGIKVNRDKTYWEIESLCNLCTMKEPTDQRSFETMVALAVENIRFKCDYIICPQTQDDLKGFIRRVNDLTEKPDQVIVLNKLKVNLFNTINQIQTKWTVVTEVNTPVTLDDGVDKVKSPYFAFPFNSGDVDSFDEHIVEYGQQLMNEEMKKFAAITGKFGNVVNLKAYKFFCGNVHNFPHNLINPPESLGITEKLIYDWSDFPIK